MINAQQALLMIGKLQLDLIGQFAKDSKVRLLLESGYLNTMATSQALGASNNSVDYLNQLCQSVQEQRRTKKERTRRSGNKINYSISKIGDKINEH